MSDFIEWFWSGGALILYGVVLLWTALFIYRQATTTSACLRAGYPTASVTWTLERYCIKRLEQTDVVVPFVERNKREVEEP